MKNKVEARSRVIIDRLLEGSGWNILDEDEVQFEISGNSGRNDYVLFGDDRPLCILEAKNENEEPYDAKEQARGYAEEIGAPFIILSNGKEHWFWNYALREQQDAYRIEKFPTQKDLIWLYKKNLNPPAPLSKLISTDYFSGVSDIQLRGYQLRACQSVAEGYDSGTRSFLLEMATGTGKTVLAATLIKRFLETRNANRVLFIVDRIELAKQTFETFQKLLPEYSPVIYKNARNKPAVLWGSNIVIATIQSLMTGRRFRSDFSPFHFDLVINDEAHRSIYGDSRECVQYFQSIRVGLTATPKAYLKNIDLDDLQYQNPKALEARQLRDTYNFFGCEPGEPTFRYDILDAVNDAEGPFLCLPQIWSLKSDITMKALEENGWSIDVNGEEESFKIRDLERKVFIPERNNLMCQAFLKKAKRSPDGKIGKSILFAVNQKHATALTQILNAMIPEVAVTITSNIRDASGIGKEFRKGERKERIAVTVDMLSTGYDCSDVINIGLMRPIFSPIQYLQIKGRGTRLHTWKSGEKKDRFYILDFCEVSRYFDEKYDYEEPLVVPGGSQRKNDSGFAPFSTEEEKKAAKDPKIIPIYDGKDELLSEECKIIGPEGEKVDVLTFRGSFEQDIQEFSQKDTEFNQAVQSEDDDRVEEILHERFFNRPDMFYTPSKLLFSYGVPGTTADFVYHALKKRELRSPLELLEEYGNSLASKNNFTYSESKWVDALVQAIGDNTDDLDRFLSEDPTLFERGQFRSLGGINRLKRAPKILAAIEELRGSQIIRKLQEVSKGKHV